MRTLLKWGAGLIVAGLALPAIANDSVAEMSTGGIIFTYSDKVSMESEELFVSEDEITVDYVFLNNSDEDVETLVAFPMPDITGNPYEMPAIPFEDSDNFLGFSVVVDGRPVTPNLEQKAFALGLDITSLLVSDAIPLMPFDPAADLALKALPLDDVGGSPSGLTLADLKRRGAIEIETWDVGNGPETRAIPIWTLKSTYWWPMVFPAGQKVVVSHRYVPSLGASAGLNFITGPGKFGWSYDDYVDRYCMDPPFLNAVTRGFEGTEEYSMPFFEYRISYILRTAQSWLGPIKRFHLTVDKGSTSSLVSFCASGVKKTAPTRFEVSYTDFVPERDFEVLLLKRSDY